MGQYFLFVNLDKKQYLSGTEVGGGSKLAEWCLNKSSNIFPYLLAYRWKGDSVAMIGDYHDPDLYEEILNDYEDISELVVREYNDFIGEPKFMIKGGKGRK